MDREKVFASEAEVAYLLGQLSKFCWQAHSALTVAQDLVRFEQELQELDRVKAELDELRKQFSS